MPFEEDGGVVAQGAVVSVEDAADEAAECFGDGQVVGVVAQEEAEEAVEAEFAACGVTRFDDAASV